jgi:hypothetical protein
MAVVPCSRELGKRPRVLAIGRASWMPSGFFAPRLTATARATAFACAVVESPFGLRWTTSVSVVRGTPKISASRCATWADSALSGMRPPSGSGSPEPSPGNHNVTAIAAAIHAGTTRKRSPTTAPANT